MTRCKDQEHLPIRDQLDNLYANIPKYSVEKIKANRKFQSLHSHMDGQELTVRAKEWWLIEKLNAAIPRMRLKLLQDQANHKRPLPYSHLSEVTLTAEKLVQLSHFDIKGGALIRGKKAFTMVPSREQINSSFWVFNELVQLNPDHTYVRLGPFLHGPSDTFRPMQYKMVVYGPPFEWESILGAKEEVHGRWIPDTQPSNTEFTEFVWSPRGKEIHFLCEEVPIKKSTDIRGSRYFHAIYSKTAESVIHMDGAVRIFSDDEWSTRKDCHIRKSDKIGTRVKTFLIDHHVSIEVLSSVCCNFFVWNRDVYQYFDKGNF